MLETQLKKTAEETAEKAAEATDDMVKTLSSTIGIWTGWPLQRREALLHRSIGRALMQSFQFLAVPHGANAPVW